MGIRCMILKWLLQDCVVMRELFDSMYKIEIKLNGNSKHSIEISYLRNQNVILYLSLTDFINSETEEELDKLNDDLRCLYLYTLEKEELNNEK